LKTNGLHALSGVNDEVMAQIHVLSDICHEADSVDIKFNYSMIANRKSGDICDFCWIHEGKLVGYAPLDRFGKKGEITAAVHPAFRRQGIFTNLFTAATEQAKLQQCTELLLVSYRDSTSGAAAVRRLGLPHKISEYSMSVQVEDVPIHASGEVTLIDAGPEDVEELSRMLAISFPESGWGAPEDLLEKMLEPDKRYYLAQISGRTIGHIGVTIGDHATYIGGVGILPEWRRMGYGRQMLAATIARQIEAGATRFELDVATENESALNIYTSCGFQQCNVYDYYIVF